MPVKEKSALDYLSPKLFPEGKVPKVLFRENNISAVNSLKDLTEIKEGEKPSILLHSMMNAVFLNEKRKKYLARFLQIFLNMPYQEIYDKLVYTKNNFDKEKLNDRNISGDVVTKLDDVYVSLEINNSMKVKILYRNNHYANTLFSTYVKEGKDLEYSNIIQINLNNFSVSDNEEWYDVVMQRTQDGEVANDKMIFIVIYVSKLYQLWYNKYTRSKLTANEKAILAFVEPNIEEAKKMAEGDKIMEEYVKESVEISKDEELSKFFSTERDIYLDAMLIGQEQGEIIGKAQGKAEGSKEKQQEIAKNMIKDDASTDLISKYTGLTISEIESLKSEI